MNPHKKPTMQDVATTAGVSKMTVSYALRYHPCISEKTASRIRAIAKAMNYTPNPLVAALCGEVRSRNKSANPPKIAYLGFHESRSSLREGPSVIRRYFEGAKMRSEELGFQLDLFEPIIDKIPAKRLSEILRYRNISAIMVSTSNRHTIDYGFDWDNFYGISFGSFATPPLYNKVTFHHYKEMLDTLRRITAMGYSRIAVVLNPSWLVTENYQAAILFFHQNIPACQRILPVYGTHRLTSPHHFRRWLNTHQPDILVDASAGHIWKTLRQLKIRVPRDLAYVTFSVHEESANLAGVNQNSHKIGAVAVDLLINQINSNSKGQPATQHTTLVSGSWTDGPTAPPLLPMRSKV